MQPSAEMLDLSRLRRSCTSCGLRELCLPAGISSGELTQLDATIKDRRLLEYAVTVAEDWQGRGLGVLLMRHLIEMARRKGFARMFSIDATDNQAMRDLASYLGFHRRLDPGDSTQVIHSLDLR